MDQLNIMVDGRLLIIPKTSMVTLRDTNTDTRAQPSGESVLLRTQVSLQMVDSNCISLVIPETAN